MNVSPTRSVPSCTRMVATGPRPRSSFDSSTVPDAFRFGLALYSPMSLTSRIISSSVSSPVFFFADTGTMTVWPPQSSGTRFRSANSRFTRSASDPGLVDLVDRDDDRHVRRLRVIDRFARLRHDTVVGGDNQHDHVGDLRTACPHQRKCFMARRVEEYDVSIVRGDVIGADMLGNATGFALGHARRSDGVEERGLAVIDVAHHGHDRRSRDGIFRLHFLRFHLEHVLLERAKLYFRSELTRDHRRRFSIDRAVDRHHEPLVEQLLENILHPLIQLVSEVLHRHSFDKRDRPRDRRRSRRCGCLRTHVTSLVGFWPPSDSRVASAEA